MAGSHNNCCSGKTIHSLCIAELNITVNSIKILRLAPTMPFFDACTSPATNTASLVPHVTYLIFRSDMNPCGFSRQILGGKKKKSSISNITDIRPLRAPLIHADRRTDGHEEDDRRFPRLT